MQFIVEYKKLHGTVLLKLITFKLFADSIKTTFVNVKDQYLHLMWPNKCVHEITNLWKFQFNRSVESEENNEKHFYGYTVFKHQGLGLGRLN